ncbi:hypothetical protein CFII64_01471 [Pseudomonas sp. CFII64]|nr:hypothetical protein CFII64_01471 [Pseudomonas sp. CFII64]
MTNAMGLLVMRRGGGGSSSRRTGFSREGILAAKAAPTCNCAKVQQWDDQCDGLVSYEAGRGRKFEP